MQQPNLTDETFHATLSSHPTPMLVLFRSTFCGPSSAVAMTLDDIRAEDEAAGRYTLFEVDVEVSPAITREFQVKGTPTLIWFHEGAPLGSRAGTMSPEFLDRFIGDMLARAKAA